ncbi:hypothetical protein CJ030_MR3G001125 [Morella rubra]|uniref:Uncharacterized protein n=1 Tax=Morella rubra TaxID=262757 RepID=A0A6A1W2E8_9ROSI|nr:hypothetical protein CJ030_MR3G001125 [Morella rubra]
MGVYASTNKSNLCDKDVQVLMEKTRLLQKEIKEMVYERKKERKAYERDMMVLAFKEAEWKQEKKRLRAEVKRLRKIVEEEDETRRMAGQKSEKEWELLGSSFLVEKLMEEERARRDDTVEKWKQLYLAIKMELDDLIQRTRQGDIGHYWRAEEEEMIEVLQGELQAKEETIKALNARLASMEREEYKKEREIDILRQSLRIMSSKMASRVTKKLP